MSPSDPYDDDDFFSDPAALASLAALEEQAIAASQAPKKKTHHTLARPSAGPRASASSSAVPPRPLNTNPRVTLCGMGWEPGGKHASKYEQQHQPKQPPRPQPPAPQAKAEPLFLPRPSPDEPPYDALVDEGRDWYQNGGESLRGRASSVEARNVPLPGSQARREAIEAWWRGGAAGRTPLSRTTSSTSTGGIPNPPALGVTRNLARSISTGSHGLAPRGPASRISALPPISSQSSGSQPSSQGAAARRAVFERDEQVKLREAERQRAEAELRALRTRVAELEATEGTEDREPRIAELKQQLYAANGQVDTVRRNQKNLESKLNAEIKRLKEENQDMDRRMKERENEMRQQLESVKTQAVFSNHNALASASKARQQSQLTSSQRQAQATPMKMTSPLRNRGSATPAPLVHSAKGKGRMAAPPPPRFEGLANAFSMAPALGRSKRQRTEAPSPTSTPKKQRTGSTPSSPAIVSPLASPHSQRSQRQSQLGDDMDIGMDWQPDFEPNATEDTIAEPPPRNLRDELAHHIMTHQTLSSYLRSYVDTGEGSGDHDQCTVVQISYAGMQSDPETRPWHELGRGLFNVCLNPLSSFEDAGGDVMTIFTELLENICHWNPVKSREWIKAFLNVARLVSSTILLFPTIASSDSEATIFISSTVRTLSRTVQEVLAELHSLGAEELRDIEVAMVDAIVELGEALCLADMKDTWSGDELSHTILNFMQSEQSAVVARGLDLFVVASCYQHNLHPILAPTDSFPGDVPVIDRVARFLANGHAKFPPKQFARSSLAALGALYMLSKHDPDAIVLLTAHSVLVPSLLMMIHRESTNVWGICAHSAAVHGPIELLLPGMTLLHHLVFPPPLSKSISASQPRADVEGGLFAGPTPQGVDLRQRLQETASTSEFNGLQHVFLTALGAMTFIEDEEGEDGDLRTVQELAGDLLDAVVEGPESDQVAEMYTTIEEASGDAPDDEEYGDEEEMMGGIDWPPSQE